MRAAALLLLNYATVSRAAKGMRCKRIGFGLRGFESLPVALLLLCACKVYLPACQPSEDPPVGVTVHRVDGANGFEFVDEDGGDE